MAMIKRGSGFAYNGMQGRQPRPVRTECQEARLRPVLSATTKQQHGGEQVGL